MAATSPAQLNDSAARVRSDETRANAVTNPEELRREPTSGLAQRLINDVQALVDRQIDLVKQELREDLHQVAAAAKSLAIGASLLLLAVICFFDFLFLLIAAVFGAHWGWIAALVVTVILGIIGGILVKKGVGEVKVEPLARTRETLKEDAEWAKHRLTSNGKSNRSETISPQPSRN